MVCNVLSSSGNPLILKVYCYIVSSEDKFGFPSFISTANRRKLAGTLKWQSEMHGYIHRRYEMTINELNHVARVSSASTITTRNN